ncbi:MAG TPA: response regulator transcription factor [Ktedonobacteraceae bacterium]|nr:response regulator transcription factor [Ktedonobacteraceae bacterium]
MPQDRHILVVDDEPGIQDFIQRNLELRSFKVSLASNGLEALAQFEQATFVLVILDIMMPSMDGLEVCRRIRQRSTVPIIILTALGEEADKIAALDKGADDYLTKPFGVGELLARVRAVLRRSHWTETPISLGTRRFGHLEIDFEQQQVWKEGELVKLSPTEFSLLQELALHPGKLFTHEALLRRVWGTEYRSEAEYLRVYIGRLRRKLEADPAKPVHILTEPGVGYYMVK